MQELSNPRSSSQKKDPNQSAEFLNFIEECEEIAADLTKGIGQSRKAKILLRKEQAELFRQKGDLADMLELA